MLVIFKKKLFNRFFVSFSLKECYLTLILSRKDTVFVVESALVQEVELLLSFIAFEINSSLPDFELDHFLKFEILSVVVLDEFFNDFSTLKSKYRPKSPYRASLQAVLCLLFHQRFP